MVEAFFPGLPESQRYRGCKGQISKCSCCESQSYLNEGRLNFEVLTTESLFVHSPASTLKDCVKGLLAGVKYRAEGLMFGQACLLGYPHVKLASL